MEDQVEEQQLIVEAALSRATRAQLEEFCIAVKVEGTQAGMRKTRLMKLTRNHIEAQWGDTPEENLEYLRKISDALEEMLTPKDADEYPQMGGHRGQASRGEEGKSGVSELAQLLHSLTAGSSGQASARTSLFSRQLKIVGVIAAPEVKEKGAITYSNLCGQITDAHSHGYTNDEVMRAVRRAISATSPLRSYFDSQTSVELPALMSMLRDFYGEKSCAELFHDLGCLCQKPQETATDFLVRALELRQKVTSAASVEGNLYERKLIQETFCRALRTGFSNERVRTHMRGFLDPTTQTPGTDQVLLHQVNIAASESEETAVKQKATVKKVTINEASATPTSSQAHEPQDVTKAIKPLLEGMALLQKQVQGLQERANQSRQYDSRRQYDNNRQHDNNSNQVQRPSNTTTTWQPTGRAPGRPYYRCKGCTEKNEMRCNHCFNCGSAEHRARECPTSKNA